MSKEAIKEMEKTERIYNRQHKLAAGLVVIFVIAVCLTIYGFIYWMANL